MADFEPDPATVEACAKVAERVAEANLDDFEATDRSSVAQGIANTIRSLPLPAPATDGEAEKLAERLVEIPRDLCWTEDRGSHRNLQIGELAHQAAARLRSQDRKDV